jgi:ubiquinone/menaquinone biosynthesis C-methylase UbiE
MASLESPMSSVDKVFEGSIPQVYEEYLVPLIFQSYARDLAARVAGRRPQAVLETAAGTGVVTRGLAACLPEDTRIVATDLNPPMLAHAQARLGRDGRVEWKQADGLALPFADATFDVVACQFGVMFFPDKVRAYEEARRVLKPSGQFLFSVWDRISENEFADVVTEALATVFPEDPPRFMVRTPHGYHDVALIRRQLRAAGFTVITLDDVPETSRAPSARNPAIAYCQGTPLRNEIEARGAGSVAQATDAAAEALARRFGPGPVAGRIRGFVFTAQA